MRILSQVLLSVGLFLGVFSLIGLYSQWRFGEFLGLNIAFLGVNLGISVFLLAMGLAVTLCVMVQDRVIERVAQQDADAAEGNPPMEDIPLCYSCLTPAEPHQHFCMNCWTPLTSHAEIDPLGQIYAMGDMYWKLTRGPSKPIALAGLWLIVGLPLVINLVLIVAFVLTLNFGRPYVQLTELLTTVGGIAVFLSGPLYLVYLGVHGMILVKAIRNRQRDPQEQLCDEKPQETQTEPDQDDTVAGQIEPLEVIEDDTESEAQQGVDEEYGRGSILLMFIGSYSATVVLAIMAPIALGYEFLINGVVYFPAGMFFLSESGDDVVLQGSLIGYAVYLVFAVIGVLFRKMSFFWCFLCILFVNYFGCLTRVLSDPR